MNSKSVFIVWFNHSRRAETLAAELNAQISFQWEGSLEGLWLKPLHYLILGWKTWALLERERPEAVVVQSPPIFAPLIVATWCMLQNKTGLSKHRVSYAIDCHTGTFHDPKWRWALPLLHFLSRRAAVTLVTDRAALEILQSWKVSSLLLEDALPVLGLATSTIGSEGEARVAVVSKFDSDEPMSEVFMAAQLLPHITFYITGDPRRAATTLLAQKPQNVILTGFLQGGAYSGLLRNVHGLVVLTNEPHAVNCGAYEALAMIKPAVVSDWLDLRSSFTRGFIHVPNTPEGIASGVKKMLDEQARLTEEV